MRKAARIVGLVWMTLVIAGGVVLMAAGTAIHLVTSSARGVIYILFAAMLPGILLWRWGRAPDHFPQPQRPRGEPIDRAWEDGHVRPFNAPHPAENP